MSTEQRVKEIAERLLVDIAMQNIWKRPKTIVMERGEFLNKSLKIYLDPME